VVAVSGGTRHSLALRADGSVVGWGDNAYGQATPPAGLSGVVAISAGQDFSVALKSDGTVVAWGSNYRGQLNVPGPGVKVTAIAAGSEHVAALAAVGQPTHVVVTAGDGQTTPISTTFSNGLTVAVSDANNFGVPNDAVTFTIVGDAHFADGTRTTTVATDIYGRASVQLVAGRTPGTVSVTASSGAVSNYFIETVTATDPCTSKPPFCQAP